MTVASTLSKVTLSGNGATRAWPFSFPVKDASHLRVVITDPDGAQTTLANGYTVALTGSGGTVTYPVSDSPLAAGYKVTLRRVVPLTQETALANQDGFYAEVHEERFDLLAMADQQQQEQLDRTAKAPATDTVPLEFPAQEARATRIMGFDADGRAVAATTTVEQLDSLTLAALKDGKVAEALGPFTSDGTLSTITTTVPLVAQAQVSLLIGGILQIPGSGAYTVAKSGTGGSITLAEPVPAGVTVGGFVGYAVEIGRGVESFGIDPTTGHLIVTYTTEEVEDLGLVVSATDWADITGKPVSFPPSSHTHAQADVSGLTAALALLAPLLSPALTGTPTAPTAANGTNTSQIASTAFVQAAIAALLGSAPSTLDTLNELATALGNDPNFATTMVNALAGKLSLSGGTLTGQAASSVGTQAAFYTPWASLGSATAGSANGAGYIGSNIHWNGSNWVATVTHASIGARAIVFNYPAFGNISVLDYQGATTAGAAISPSVYTLRHSGNAKESIVIALGDETTAITTGTAKVTLRMPYAITLTDVRASLATAGSSATIVNVMEAGVSIFSTKLQIDSGSKTSVGSSAPRVISDTSLADDAEITLDIDTAGTGAKGLKVTLIGRQSA